MKQYVQQIRQYSKDHRDNLTTFTIIIGIVALVIATVVAIVYSSAPKIIYEPTRACSLLTVVEAKSLLGGRTIRTNNTAPQVSADNATSQCGYADGNPKTGEMLVIAIIVRAGVNDEGVARNNTDFAAARPEKGVQDIEGLGDDAFFNEANGQLNILDGRNWMILSYGVGSDPLSNALSDAKALASKILDPSPAPSNF
ncbi:MAG: hypothetical protein UY35_C0002G0055 [Candidatus Saccharibacteria bacterium GW2011_GWC2_48_9]|nr:MAG: hypothetical protein UY35_C0002G0055 [Candidatus Saccharibacteria bacterium GW2011_GWC2_48_9]HCH34946.1 hypothetical protein [Candidatus Saccharibacteria bacterium]